jgi:hypothetical protein
MPIRSHGPHRYVFQVFALDRRLDLPAKFKLGDALNAMSGHVIGRARLEGTFVKRLEVTRSGQRLAPDCLCLGLTLPGNDAKALGWSLQSRQSRLC